MAFSNPWMERLNSTKQEFVLDKTSSGMSGQGSPDAVGLSSSAEKQTWLSAKRNKEAEHCK